MWEDYPILKFDETPAIEVVVLDRPGSPGLGAGECAAGPTAAAIANALHHALGVRARDLPLTPERVAQAMESSWFSSRANFSWERDPGEGDSCESAAP